MGEVPTLRVIVKILCVIYVKPLAQCPAYPRPLRGDGFIVTVISRWGKPMCHGWGVGHRLPGKMRANHHVGPEAGHVEVEFAKLWTLAGHLIWLDREASVRAWLSLV